MRRILHISKYYYPFRGGTEQVARDCVNALETHFEQKVLCFNDTKSDAVELIDDIEIIRAGCFTKIASQSLSFTYGRLLKQIINEFKPDIIILHYPNPFGTHFLLKYISNNCSLIVYWHLDIVKQKVLRLFFERQNWKLIDRASILIATSPNYIQGSKFLSSALDKSVVIPNCINEKRMLVTPQIEAKAKRIRKENIGKTLCLAVGRHSKYKGFNYLIKAAHLLDDSFKVFLVGSGEETEKLKTMAKRDEKIVFLGSIEDDDLKAYMCAMDVFCFPSITRNEAFGLALVEAMYFKKPVVCFNIPGSGVNYVSLGGKTGIEVKNRDVKGLVCALEKLASDVPLRKKMSMAGKKRVEEEFLFEKYKERINNLIVSLNGEKEI